MNLLIKHSKKFILAILLFALVITANFGLINATICAVNASEVHGFDGFTDQVNVSISNNTFSSNSSTADGYPYTPKNWTYNTTKASNNVKHGLVNLSATTYKNNYENYGLGEKENPGKLEVSSDNYALMINSRLEKSSSGYVSDAFTLSKNGYYHVSVNVYTDNVDGAASLYLFNGDKVFASITNINTKGNWSNNAYHFLIATKDYEDLELTFGLWQGSKEVKANACVMFDEVRAGQISSKTLSDLLKGTGLNGRDKTNFENICYIQLENDNNLDATSITINQENLEMVEEESNNIADSNYSTFYIDENKLEIENLKENNICFETGEYELLSNKVYKFSVLAKTENLTTGSAFFKAVEATEDSAKSASVEIKTTTNKLNDNYTEYSIIVVSDPLKTKSIKFMFGLGTNTSTAKGKVTFSGVVARSVPYTVFSEADGNAKTIDFTESYDLSSIDNLVGNFAFYNSEATEIAGDNKVAINDPANWEVLTSGKGYTQKAGVYNVADFDKVIKNDLTNFLNPGFIESINNESNNVLMLYNAMEDVLVCRSESLTLSKNSYYKVSVWVNTQTDEHANINIVKSDDSKLALAGLTDINTNGNWEEKVFYIKSAYEDLSVSLDLGLGSNKQGANGYAYFDNCFVTTATEEEYNNSLVSKFDLTNPLNNKEDGKPVYFSGKSNGGLNSTVSYLLNIEDLSSVMVKADATSAYETFKGENKNVLAIHSTNTDDYYTLTSKLNYYLESGSYYKISVDVYTAYLKTDVENGVAGAGIKLTNLEDGQFINIKNTENAWTTYTFYVNPDSSVTSELVFALGSEEYACHGTALFGNILVEKIADQESFVEATSNVNEFTKVLGKVINNEGDGTTNETESTINWQLFVYTLTAVAVIIAVVGVGFKKIVKPGKKRVKKTTPDYDRDASVLRQKYRRLACIKRDKDIRKLEKELALLHEDRADKEDKYKQLLSKVREVKLANRDGKLNSELAALNKNMSKASQNVAKIGIMVNKINNEIAFMKTEGYMQGLERKLMKQDELAKAKGYSIEQVILAEDETVEINTDKSLDEALTKADKIIEDKKEEARLEAERIEAEKAEQERLEAERLEQERLEKERLEQEKLEQERLEQERLEKERLEKENASLEEVNNEQIEENKEAVTESQEEVNNASAEEETVNVEQVVENEEKVAETQENEQNSDISNEDLENNFEDSSN